MRGRILTAIVTASFILLAAGLFYTQVIRHGYYLRLSKNNSIRLLPIDGPRGNILDRKGRALVSNRLSFDVAIIYDELKDRGRLAKALREVLGLSKRDIIEALSRAGNKPYVPVTIAEDIGTARALVLEENTIDTPGLIVQARSKRGYLYGKSASHVLGYLSEITETELEGLRDYGYRARDLLGRDGLEKYYETYLKGVDGGTQVEVDSHGRQTKVLGIREPASGHDLYLTIDMGLQLECDRLLGERHGSIIVMNPKSGEILALASSPGYDPNVFVRPEDSGERVALMNDKVGRPMMNRAISGQYPPGSVFKIVTAAAALETKSIGRDTVFLCTGSFNLARASFDCWKAEGHGPQAITEGIMNSCNVFFYNAGKRAGADAIESYARTFGLGRVTGVDLPDEKRGLVPGRSWKRSLKKEEWYEGDTLNYSIGQGYLLTTPIQIANMTAVVANNGYLEHPFIVKRIGPAHIMPGRPKNTGIDTSTLKLIREGMYRVVNSEGGTGKRARTDGVTIAGKTGTAQNPQGRSHAWFTGFAPYEDPKACVVVFLEHGGKGGLGPAEIASGVFEEAKKSGLL